jgi:rare lipoprotein A (peptidoglycan hydrolase)
VAWHASVVLTTATAPAATATTRAAHAAVRVPDLINRDRAQVYALMRRDNLYFTTRGPGSATGTWTRVTGQSPRPGTVVAWHASVVLTTATAPAATATTRAATTAVAVTRPAPVAPVPSRVGVATWYAYIPGQCATSYLPMGTVITVRDLSSGVTLHCVVTDRQEVAPGRVVDLSEQQFRALAPLWRGVVRVRVSW